MIVSVRLFARGKDLAGADVVRLELPAGATVCQMRQALGAAVPALAGLLGNCVVALDYEFAANDAVIHECADVALIPPVSGGQAALPGPGHGH